MIDTTRIEQVIPVSGLNSRHEWLSTASLTFSPEDVTINPEMLSNLAGTTTASVPEYLQMYADRTISDRIDSAIYNGTWNVASTTSNTYPYRRLSRDPAHEPASSWLFDEETIRDAVERVVIRSRFDREMNWSFDDVQPDPPIKPEPIPQEDLLQAINLE